MPHPCVHTNHHNAHNNHSCCNTKTLPCYHFTAVLTPQERVVLLDAWRETERTHGDSASLRAVEGRMPRRLKKRRMLTGDAGEEVGWEEYYDYRFPDDEQAPANLKILEMAQKWKLAAAAAGAGSSAASSSAAASADESSVGGGGTKRKAGDDDNDDDA
jgi:crooked neck